MAMKKSREELMTDKKINRRNFISFALFGAYIASAYTGIRWIYKSPNETPGITGGARKPLRKALNKTEIFFRRLTFNENHLVKTYPRSMAAKEIRHNSDIGSAGELLPENWKLQVKKITGETLQNPQTLLAYQMNDELLNGKHGQPLRLIIPVKYGIKNLKRIGTIIFSNSRLRDYWAELGYDYFSGL